LWSPLPTVPPAASPPPSATPLSPNEPQPQKKGGGAFFSSPAGIALVVILGLALVAGITLGIVFLVKGGANHEVDAATVKVWDDYESMLENNSDDIPKITTDQASLAKTQEELKQSQEKLAALQKSLEKNAGTEARRSGGSTSRNTRDVKADELAASLKAYVKYLEKLNELVTALTGANLLDANTVNNINRILADLSDLGADVKVTANKFLADNSKIVTVKIDPPVLKLPKTAAVEIQASVTAAQNAEKQRLEAEKAAADAAAAAAEAERQRQAAAAAEQQQQQAHYVDCPACWGGTMQDGTFP